MRWDNHLRSLLIMHIHLIAFKSICFATRPPPDKAKTTGRFRSAGERDVQETTSNGTNCRPNERFLQGLQMKTLRDEDREAILREIPQQVLKGSGKNVREHLFCIADRTEAIATAFAHARPGR